MTDKKELYWNRMVPELTVTDFPSSLHFYVDIIGFGIMVRRSDPEFAYICLGEAQLMLEQYHEEGWNTGRFVKPLGRGVNFQIEVDEIASIYSRIQKNNIQLYRSIGDNYYKIGDSKCCQREFLVQDPDGYLLRFSQYIE
ncbi:bleomycin resistance protein [Xenorhabdus budapestensis]|uniref:Bleomycin resistance protein n=1 Tax=Xenorhabdus budapestensis TaxID=290110 RepID=A0A2D0ITB2_XENBU|nr:VOC family protein [Xenorhabdus budapestensis]PHM25105.1 bleomycin resistance protein Ble [Xenorhabdus budapestensis]QTL39121.1 VOC family protein [Xenorhabdus budapestensis]